jgi:hypothetical protein
MSEHTRYGHYRISFPLIEDQGRSLTLRQVEVDIRVKSESPEAAKEVVDGIVKLLGLQPGAAKYEVVNRVIPESAKHFDEPIPFVVIGAPLTAGPAFQALNEPEPKQETWRNRPPML